MKLVYITLIGFILAFSFLNSAVITIDTNVKHQTIMGYGSASWYPEWISAENKKDIIKEYVNVFGINRLRLEPPAGSRSIQRSWEWLNDNNDPDSLDWAKIIKDDFDKRIASTILEYKRLLEMKGEKLNVYISPSFFDGGSSGAAASWLENSPAEYTEFALSVLKYMRDTYNIEADYYSILNEAGNNNRFSSKLVADMIKYLGPKLEAEGFKTKIQFPECVNTQTSLKYLTDNKDDAEMWKYIGLLSYHLYGTAEPFRTQFRDSAFARGLPTAQTEYMSLTEKVLYEDMTNGGVSFWEIYGTGSCMDFYYNSYIPKSNFWKFRQLTHYVKPGYVRVETTSDDVNVGALSFIKEGKMVTVLFNFSVVIEADINNINPGSYYISRSVNGKEPEELGVQQIQTGTYNMQMPANSITTIYPKDANNLEPLISSCLSNPKYLKLPASSITLSVKAVDPELDNIAYSWTLVDKPAGAEVNIANPSSANTTSTGLTVIGEYKFKIIVGDDVNSDERYVRVNVYDSNQPPYLLDLHNRLPVRIFLPQDSTVLRAGAWDLESDTISFLWRIISQPDSSDIILKTPDKAACVVSNIQYPGNYLFEIRASDKTNISYDTLEVPVYENLFAPEITMNTTNTDTVVLPANVVELKAEVTDNDNTEAQPTIWWSLISSPQGSKPIIESPGKAITKLKNLNIAGDYTVSCTAIDETKKSSKKFNIIVEEPSNMEDKQNDLSGIVLLFPNPSSEKVYISIYNPKQDAIEITIYNVLGCKIKTLNVNYENKISSGIWDNNDVVAGIYYAVIRLKGRCIINEIVIAK